jgi:hypothetical protein
MELRNAYFVQPYHVGTKKRQSLAIIIPAGIARKYNVSTSTGFEIRVDKKTKTILMHSIAPSLINERQKIAKPAGESFQAADQQVTEVT